MKTYVYKGNEYHITHKTEHVEVVGFIKAYREVESGFIEILTATQYNYAPELEDNVRVMSVLPQFLQSILDHREQAQEIRVKEAQEEFNYEFERELQAI